MRTDKNLARTSFRFSRQWKHDAIRDEQSPQIDQRLAGGRLVDGKFVAHSLSGQERNHLFFNSGGTHFTNISAVSGLDTAADSRGFVLWDYDRDGWQDVAVVNANAPRLNLYHNEIGRCETGGASIAGQMIALRFVGGSRTAAPSSHACRDGYGAMVTLTLDGYTLKREHRCGEGFATQNSNTMVVGIGQHSVAMSVAVRWPSGASQRLAQIPAGTLLTVYEDASQSPTGKPITSQPYWARTAPASRPIAESRQPKPAESFVLDSITSTPPAATGTTARLRMYTTMATWCPSCKRHLPQLQHLRETFPAEVLELIGVPIDETDSAEMLQDYAQRFAPPYRLLLHLTGDQRDELTRILNTSAPEDALPSTIITDQNGNLFFTQAGIPTVSQLRKLLYSPSLTLQES